MTFDEVVLKELGHRVESLQQALIAGNVKDYVEYRQMVGELRGLSLAINTVKDLAANLRDNDE
jgi:hypothetical protein